MNSYTIRFVSAVEQAIDRHDMIGENQSVLIGVSGGPDSMALLHILQTLAPKRGWRLAVAHLNHGIRPRAAESDEVFVHQTTIAMGLPFHGETADVRAYRKTHGLSLEEAGREVRYQFLARTADIHGYPIIALGHHADDNAELILMNLLRGSGPLGLSGMMPRRPFPLTDDSKKTVRLIRPLLDIRREVIAGYIAENNIASVTDATNTDLRYRRNRIRLELVPLLQSRYNRNIVDALNRLADIIRPEESWVEKESETIFQRAIMDKGERSITLSASKVSSAHLALQRRIIRKAIRGVKGNLRRISLGHIDTVVELAGSPKASGRLDLPDRIRVVSERDRLLFEKSAFSNRDVRSRLASTPALNFEYTLTEPGTLSIPELSVEVRADILSNDLSLNFPNAGHRTAFFDMNAVSFPLTIRSIQPGDRIRPLGMDGTQKVKKYFSDHKIPVHLRARCPVLVSRGRLIWLMGYRLSETARIRPNTRNVLRVSF